MTVINLFDQRKWVFDKGLAAFLFISSSILIFSFYQQHAANIEPCLLCKWQRLIYCLVVILSPFGFIQEFNLSIRKGLTLLFLIGFSLAIYHALVQFGWFYDRCTVTQKIENMNDFILMLEQPKSSCAKIDWKLFGLSASIYNVVFSLVVFIYLTLNLRNQKNG